MLQNSGSALSSVTGALPVQRLLSRVQATAQLHLAEATREVAALRAKLAAASGTAHAKADSLAKQHRELKQVLPATVHCMNRHRTRRIRPGMHGLRTQCPSCSHAAVLDPHALQRPHCTLHRLHPATTAASAARWQLSTWPQEQVARQQLQRALDRQEARMAQLTRALADRDAQLAAVKRDASSLREQKSAVESWLDN